jgi:excinuclease UvrABC nuclease subunit
MFHGRSFVGSMVVSTGGRADKAAYRRPIVGVQTEEANDVAMLAEVLKRRFAREKTGDTRIATRQTS